MICSDGGGRDNCLFLTGIPLVQAVNHVKACAFFWFLGCFRVLRDMGGDGGLIDQDWWCCVGVLGILTGIPLFWDVAPVRSCAF